MAQPLLTPASVALSLAPPRSPPHGSALRNLLLNPQRDHNHHRDGERHGDYGEGGNLYGSHNPRLAGLRALSRHPHLPHSLSLPDRITRLLGSVLPLETQHAGRDGGYFRAVADGMVKMTCPLVGLGHWDKARAFAELSLAGPPTRSIPPPGETATPSSESEAKESLSRKRRRGWTRKRVSYGDHEMQYFDLFLPARRDDGPSDKISVRGTLFFVHGGAWGSGQPWMYRLVAVPFLELGVAVVIAGYRTYPDAPTIDDQVDDVRWAWDRCEGVLDGLVAPVKGGGDSGWIGNAVCGHSSGAHVALLLLVDMMGESATRGGDSTAGHAGTRYPWDPHFFVGLSGPYDISYHFDYEAGRGVEQISPMKPICGHTREGFDRASPAKRLRSLLGELGDGVARRAPPTLLVHGIEDATVPFTATSDAGRTLRACGMEQCDEVYLEETGHQDVIMHFMMGGPAKDIALDWLLRRGRRREGASSHLRSRL